MKAFIAAFSATLLGAVMLVAALPAAAAAGPIDCTSGCEIVPCTTNYCTVWRCDSGGCLIVGGYESRLPRSRITPGSANRPQAFAAVCDATNKQPCAIKTCTGGECAVSLFDGKAFVPIGRVEDIDSLVEKATQQLRR